MALSASEIFLHEFQRSLSLTEELAAVPSNEQKSTTCSRLSADQPKLSSCAENCEHSRDLEELRCALSSVDDDDDGFLSYCQIQLLLLVQFC